MLKLYKKNRSDGGAEHQEAVANRLRGLSSVAHDLAGQTPEDLRRRLKGGRSERARGATVGASS
jgi:hypothetical protein